MSLLLQISVPCLCFGAGSSLFTRILHDFSPLTGRVLSVDGQFITVDCGTAAGVVTGDLFQVYRKGSPVTRGQSEGIIGYLKKPFALVQVKQVADRWARCTVLSSGRSIRIGMPVMRYSDMTAVLVTAPGMKVADVVRRRFFDTLPALNWKDEDTIGKPVTNAASMREAGVDLVFYLSTGRLTVYGPGFHPLRSYPLSGDSLAMPAAGKGGNGSDRDREAASHTVAAGRHEPAVFEWDRFLGPSSVDLERLQVAGRLDQEARQVEIADMDGDGSPDAVYLIGHTLYLLPFGSSGPLLSWEVRGPGNVVGFSVCPDRGWIVLNVLMQGVGLRSVLLHYANRSFEVRQDDINLWLSFYDMDGNGSRDTLIGQTFDLHSVWGEKVYRLSISPQGIDYDEQLFLPDDFRIGWAEWGDIDGNGRMELCLFDRVGRIWIYEDGILRWSSPAGLLRSTGQEDEIVHCVMSDVFGNGRQDMVFSGTVQGQDDAVRTDVLCCIRWENGRFEIAPVSRPFHAAVVGISNMDRALLIAVVNASGEGEKGSGRTTMYRLPLAPMHGTAVRGR